MHDGPLYRRDDGTRRNDVVTRAQRRHFTAISPSNLCVRWEATLLPNASRVIEILAAQQSEA
jgi:hypothetical protein